MTINRDAEENIRKSVKKIEERLKFYEKNYAIKDRQDLLAMCLIEIATKLESVNEGRYHDWRNDESLNPKQKIGYSMREVRDKLNELDKLVKMNVRFKNEIGVDSSSYWKRTHTAMKKISERLVKLANKVGQLY